MAFADARGIPNQFWVGGKNGEPLSPSFIPTYEGNQTRKGFSINKWQLTIPELHKVMDSTMRNNIKDQTDPLKPKYGVDANRDYYISLHSSRAFLDFINKINGNIPDLNMRETNNQKREEIAQQILDRNIRVLMIHGYDDTQPGLCVYGPYTVEKGDPERQWPAQMSQPNKDHVNEIRRKLGFREIKDVKQYLYGKTAEDARPYQGEWLWQLYDRGIWSADIELHPDYNEYVRGAGYDYLKIGELGDLPDRLNILLEGFPWKE
jgi:hypothetical protein